MCDRKDQSVFEKQRIDITAIKMKGNNKMSVNYIDRSNDEEIIDIVRSVMDNGTGIAETANEHILIKLMQLRGTPMTSFEFDQERVDFYYDQWKNEKTG